MKKVIALIATLGAVLTASQWKDIVRYLRIRRM
jgi:hypothetical protein